MRKRGWVLGAVLVAGAVALVASRKAGEEAPHGTAPAPVRRAVLASHPTAVPQAPRPTGALRIQGTVVDRHGRPVAGARVSASWPVPGETLSELPCPPEALHHLPPGESTLADCYSEAAPLIMESVEAWRGEAPVHAEATTAADGTFTLEGLSKGPLALWALGERGAAMHSGIHAGTEGVELVLEEGHILEGTVQGEGAPLAGVRVTALSFRHTRFFETTTGADGRYQLGPLPRNVSLLVFTKEDWLPDQRFIRANERRQANEVTLQRPRTLSGRVRSSSGAPVPGIQVELRVGPGTVLPGTPYREVTADARGRFTFLLPSGQYTLTAASEGQSALARVELGTQASPEVVLELGSSLQVQGQVLDDARRPVAGADIEVRHTKDPLQFRRAVTDAEGHYTAGPLEPGTWRFSVDAPRFQAIHAPHTLTADMGPLDFTLERLPTIEGRVTGVRGHPLPGLEVFLQRPDAEANDYEATDETDEEGRFILEAPTPGAWRVVMEDRHRVEPVTVQAPARDVHLTTRPGASVEGTLVDSRGLPLEGFAVTLVLEGQKGPFINDCDTTDAWGRFALRDVKPGAYFLLASQSTASVERRVWRPVELREEASVEVELRLPVERTLSGVVVDGEDRPLPGARVQAGLPQEDAPEWLDHAGGCETEVFDGVRADEEGRFTLRYLSAPRYELQAWSRGHALSPERSAGGQAREDALLVGTDSARVRLVLERQPHIRGRLVGPDGAPLSAFWANRTRFESPEGSFAMPFQQETSPERLEFRARGMAALFSAVERRGSADVNLGEVRMEAGRGVRGRVLDAHTSKPVPDVLLRLGLADAASQRGGITVQIISRTEEDGTFESDELAPRPYTVEVIDAYGYLPSSVRVEAEQDEVTLRLEPAPP